MKKRWIVLSALLLIVLACLIAASYFSYFYITQCDTKACFDSALLDCKRISFVNDGADTVTSYKILGEENGKCAVYVKLLTVKRGTAELGVLQGKDMICSSTLGVIVEPEKNLKDCHGTLKEEIQNIIIQRMHAQIVENIGKIGEETSKIL